MISAMWRLLAAAWAFAFAAKAGGAVVISEIAAANKTGLIDENGAHVDWIELYNDGAQPVDLHGWHLTDDPLRPARWEFPPTVIAPGAYLVVFASGKDRSDTGSPLHTDFSLAAEGEYFALTDAAGVKVDGFSHGFPPQVADVSWGRVPGKPKRFAYFYTPSPGFPNQATPASDPPVLSEGGRTFTDPFTVTLSSGEQDSEIYYTLDGSEPTIASTPYTGPITINVSTRLRAVAVAPGHAVSLTSGAVYLQLAGNIVSADSNLPLMIIDNFAAGKPTSGTNAAWMIFEPGVNQRTTLTAPPSFSTSAFVKVRGSSTAGASKYSLAVEARNEAGGDRDFVLLGLPADSDWILTAPYEFDRALIRNPLMYDLSRQAGRYAPRTRQVELYINIDGGAVSSADYFGVYTLTEKIKRSAARIDIAEISPLDNAGAAVTGGYVLKIDRADDGETGFNAAGQTIFFVDPDEPQITSSQKAWLTAWLNSFKSSFSASDFYDPLLGYAKWIDPAAFVDHHILNVAAKNVDAFRLSAYFFKDRLGRLNAGPLWDFDRSLESTDVRDNNFNTWRGENVVGGDMGTDFFHYTWYVDMFRDENFWQRWIDRYDELRRGALSDGNVEITVNAQAEVLTEAAPRNFARWNDKQPRFGGWAAEVDHLRTWLTERLHWMDDQFTRPPVANTFGGPVPAGFMLDLTSPSLTKPGARIYYTTDGTDPRIFDVTTGQQIISDTLVSLNDPVKVHLPAADIGTAWHGGSAFDDSAWWTGSQGVGYDDGSEYDPFIRFNLEPPPPERRMKGVTQSCYLRFHFPADAARIAALTFLKLRIRCDDGMVAFINGTKLPESIKAPATLLWNSGATANTSDGIARVFADFIIPNPQDLLKEGDNVLAIHGLNATLNSTDFLIQVELLGGYVPANAPEMSPQAQVWNGPLAISGTTHIVARTYDPAGPFEPYPVTGPPTGQTPVGSHWSAPLRLSLLNGTVPASAANLTISEIMYHPGPLTAAEMAAGFTERSDFEYLVLQNTGALPVDLTGIHFTAGIEFTMPLGLQSVLAPSARGILVRNRAAFAMRSVPGLNILGEYRDKLSNAGEPLELRAANGDLIFTMTWDDGEEWPAGADGAGYSLVRVSGAALSSPDGWRRSLDVNGEAQGAVPLSFAAWQAVYFPEGGPSADPLADPDGDGTCNAAEYAAATHPLSPVDSGQPVARAVTVDGVPGVKIEICRRPGTSPWIMESSQDLSTWEAVAVPPVISSGADGRDIISWTFPQNAVRASYRARAEIP
jgi:hypothetical protein